MKRFIPWISLLLLTVLVVLPVTLAYSAFNYSYSIRIFNNSTTSYPNGLPILVTLNNSQLNSYGYIAADGLDTNVQEGATSREFMVQSARLGIFIPSFLDSQVRFPNYRLGDTPGQTTFPVIIGVGGNVTVSDNSTLELGNNFTVELDGFIDTSAGSSKNLIDKTSAFMIWVSDTSEITAAIGSVGQPIIGGFEDNLNPAAVEYNAVMGGYQWNAVENQVWQVIPTGGTIDSLFVELSAAPGAGDSYTFTLMVNGAPSALALTISGAVDTTGNASSAIALVAGDTVSIRSEFVVAPAASRARWSTLWIPTIADESILLSNHVSHNAITVYGEMQGITSPVVVNEILVQIPLPTAGTFKKLYVELSVDPGNAPDAYSTTLRDAAADTALTVTIIADDTTGNDSVNNVVVAAGALIDIKIIPLNVPVATPYVAIGMVFISDTSGESLIMGGSSADTPAISATEYLNLGGTGAATWNAIEDQRYSLTQASVLSKLYVVLSGAPGGATSYTLSIREAGGDTGLTTTIVGAATTGNDLVNTYISSDGDTVDAKVVTTAGAAVAYVHWGLVVSNPLVEVTATGVTTGEHTVSAPYDGVDLKIFIDTIEEDSAAWVGSVPDNANDWTFMENDSISYMDYLKISVDGTQQLWFEPNTMVAGSILTDRQGGDNNGTINWGVNPSNIEVTMGSVATPVSTVSTLVTSETAPDTLPPPPSIDYYGADLPDDDPELIAMPMYDSILAQAESMDMSVKTAYIIWIWVGILVMSVVGFVVVGSSWGFFGGFLFGNALAMGTPLWPLFLPVIISIIFILGLWVWRRQ